MNDPRTRRVTVLAQDTNVRSQGKILMSAIPVPFEDLEPGPTGHRVQVVDYDATTKTLYKPARVPKEDWDAPSDKSSIVNDPEFHARNVYALVTRTLQRFEAALGRRVAWGFRAHQIKVVPHAFEAENAFYSQDAEALLFGYYRTKRGLVFTSLSHDIVVHETTHALLDGLRGRFLAPSSPDQAAFHEGFADVIALLSVFSLPSVLELLLCTTPPTKRDPKGLVSQASLTSERLKDSVLFGLADEMAPETDAARVNALRRSVAIEPDANILRRIEFEEPHRRGEVFVAAMMRTFIKIWSLRLASLGTKRGRLLELGRVVEEGTSIAELMLTMVIRALDYTPPIHITFGDFLAALLTADTEVRRNDDQYEMRRSLMDVFASYGIHPSPKTADGRWKHSENQLVRDGVRLGSLQTDPIEMFRLIWSNRQHLALDPTAYTRVNSVRPSIRASADDGLPLRETVAECTQYVSVPASDLHFYGLAKPLGMANDEPVVLEGGSTLILDEYGGLKYEIHNRLPNRKDAESLNSAQARLDYLWQHGHFDPGNSKAVRIATMHRLRVSESRSWRQETW